MTCSAWPAYSRYSISPSVYVSIVGTAAVEDQCGPLGSAVTSPIIALNPGELSSYEDTIVTSIGATWFDPNGIIGGLFVGTVKPWNFAATTGPTWGLGIRTKDNGDVYYTIGPPFLPLIVPPPQLLSLDPEWRSYCTGFLSNSPGLVSFAVLDPPEVLTPVTALTPVEVPAEETSNLAVPVRITPTAQLAKATSLRIPKTTLVVVPAKSISHPSKEPEPVSLLDDSSRDEANRSDDSIPPPSKKPAKTDGPRQDGDPQQIEGPQQDQGPPQDEELLQDESPLRDDDTQQDTNFQQDNKFQQGDNSLQEGEGRSDSQPGGSSTPTIAPQPGEGIKTQFNSNIIQGGETESGFPQRNGAGTDSSSQQNSNSDANQENSGIRADDNNPPQNNRGIDPQQDERSLGRLILKGLNPDRQEVSSVPSPVVDEGDPDTSKGATIILSNGVLSLITPAAVDDSGFPNNRDPPPPQAAGSRVLTSAGQTVPANPSATPPAGADILLGEESVLIPGTPIRSGTLFVDGISIPLDGNIAPPSKSVFTVEGRVFTPNPTGFILAGANVVPGGVPVTISSIPISLGPSGTLFIGDDAIPLSNPPPLPTLLPNSVFTVGDEVFRANAIGFTVAGSKVLPGGAPVTVFGTPVSLDSSGTLFLGGTAIPLDQASLNPPNSIFTVGGEAFAPKPTGFIIAGFSVVPGGAPTTISGTRISLNTSGKLILGSSTIDLQTQSPATDLLLTVGGQVFTANPRGFAINGTPILPGSAPITISGTRISLDKSGQLTIGSSSINLFNPSPLPPSFKTVAANAALNVYTFGTLTFTVQSSSVVIFDGKTLVPDGPAITASGGRRISLNKEGSLVIGSSAVVIGGTLPVETTTKGSSWLHRQSGNSTSISTSIGTSISISISTSNSLELSYTGGQGRAAVRVLNMNMREAWGWSMILLVLGLVIRI